MIRPSLRDIRNDHKTQEEWKLHSGNTIIDYKTQEEWKLHSGNTIIDYKTQGE